MATKLLSRLLRRETGRQQGRSKQKDSGSVSSMETLHKVETFDTAKHIKPEDLWGRKTVLALDGGGIRGYISLLILQCLMELIEEVETNHPKGPHTNSAMYDTCEQTESVKERVSEACGNVFKPHHYFDYFIGTSTGGLSAIMLGRLQMTVEEALRLYDIVGNNVFAKRRFPLLPGISKAILTRYSSEVMEQTLLKAIGPALDSEYERRKDEGISKDRIHLENENPDAAQTIAVSWGGDGARDTRLFRSYNHPPPASTASKHIPFLESARTPICHVARATSAAPTYFAPIEINGDLLFDGACGDGCNNPVNLGYDEVKQMHDKPPSLVMSVGTGQMPPPKPTKNHASSLLFRDLIDILMSMKDSITDSEKTHERFRDRVEENNGHLKFAKEPEVIYHRFNVPADNSPTGVSKVKLDEWKPRKAKPSKDLEAGQITKTKMRNAVESYLHDPDNPQPLENLRECAELLVQRRRQRSKDPHWERFALNIHYECPKATSRDSHRRYKTREELRKHAVSFHGVFSKDVLECYCRSDSSGQGGTPYPFTSESELKRHLLERHGQQRPCALSREELDRWIDEGRRFPKN